MYRVSFIDWRYGARQTRYSPYYETVKDCKDFISTMINLPNRDDYTDYAISSCESKNFSEKDVDRFRQR